MGEEFEQVVDGAVGPRLEVYKESNGRYAAVYDGLNLVQTGDVEEVDSPSSRRRRESGRRRPRRPWAFRVRFALEIPDEGRADEFELLLGTDETGVGGELPSWNGVPVREEDPRISGPYNELLDAIHDLDLAHHFEEQDAEPQTRIELEADAGTWYRLYRAARKLGAE